MVYWVRPPQFFPRGKQGQPMGERDTMASLHGAPLHAGEIVHAALRRSAGGVVLAGTSLAVEGGFAMITEQLGLPASTPNVSMPVDYSERTLVLLPTDAPEPNMNSYQRVLGDALLDTITGLGGQTVVLFASHTALRATANALRPALEQAGILLLAQGIDGSLKHLWQNYRAQDRIVLFGAGGMWEGWESEGARPRCLFIPRLPLPALGDPVVAARASRSGDPVHHFTVPIAAQRLRQALNQLAWRHDDRTVIVLYDSRLITKDYGETILHTLPPVTMRQVSISSIGSDAQEWLGM
jgi:Rad3-related DNA helicase